MTRSWVLLVLVPATSMAGQTVSGDLVSITYEDGGTWCDYATSTGFQSYLDGQWVELVFPGSPWQHTSIEYDQGGRSWRFDGNTDWAAWDWKVLSESDASTGTLAESLYVWQAGDLTITKSESWPVGGSDVLVVFTVENGGAYDVSAFRLMMAFDPDQDYEPVNENFETLNDTRDRNADGVADYVESVGPDTGHTIALAPCDPDKAALGHSFEWFDDADEAFTDDEGAQSDSALHWTHLEGAIAAGETAVFSALIVVGDTAKDAEVLADGRLSRCSLVCPDADGDGFADAACGGEDCDDTDAAVNPKATETWYDGVDQDCDGANDHDRDGDGHEAAASGGDDCDDADPAVNPDASQTWYDGTDGDCSGGSDADQDGDGYDDAAYGGDDCDDADPARNPGADEIWYDGSDQDCDGASDFDQDGDGHDDAAHGGDDCDDADASRSPSAAEVWYDGIDQDCDGASDFDQDGDGHERADEGGDDCDDEDAAVWDDCADPGDTDDTDAIVEATPPGCACNAAPAPAGLGMLALVGLFARRRRQ